jgi:hypothetical protein
MVSASTHSAQLLCRPEGMFLEGAAVNRNDDAEPNRSAWRDSYRLPSFLNHFLHGWRSSDTPYPTLAVPPVGSHLILAIAE